MSASLQNKQTIAAYAAFAICLLAVLYFRCVPGLLAGSLSYVLTIGLLRTLRERGFPNLFWRHDLFAAMVIGSASLAVLVAGVLAVVKALDGESVQGLLLAAAGALEQVKAALPGEVASSIPASVLELNHVLVSALKQHSASVAVVGTSALHTLIISIVGWVVGILLAVAPVNLVARPLFETTWLLFWARFQTAFTSVAMAQLKIAGVNTLATAIFLLEIAPALGWDIPYSKTLVVLTFVFGVIPVAGNLVSNSLVFLMAIGVSLNAALAALAFLITLHKFEYVLNARFCGAQIGAKAWELLTVLFAAEVLFGPAGMVLAPVIYAFVKGELRRATWIS